MEGGETHARTQLEALRADRAAVAERVVQPWWYDVLLGLLVFAFLGSYATHDWWLIGGAGVILGLPYLLVAVSALCGVAVTLVSRWWTRIYVAELRGEL